MQIPVSKNVILLLLLILLLGCYEKKEGCLDVYATNFSLEADLDCCKDPDDCCCEYPKLSLSIKHQFGNENLSSGTLYTTDLGQPFYLDRVQFFISNVRLTEDTDFAISDSIRILSREGEVIDRPDDVKIVASGNFLVDIGSFIRPGNYVNLSFIVGLTEPERSADSGQFESSHPLSSGNKILRDTVAETWLMYDVAWIPDTLSAKVVHLSTPATTTVQISLPVAISKEAGRSITIPLGIDYQLWFGAIDLATDDEITIKQKILAGLAESFFVL